MLLLLGVFAIFGWIYLSDYVRAEFLRNRNLEFVKAARAMGLSNAQMIWRHLLPNSMTPVITFLPFRMSAAILFLAAIDFLGLGVTNVASLGDLLPPGEGQPRRLVDLGADLPAARAHAPAAHLHRRRAARRLRHPQVMSLLQIDRLSVNFGPSRVVEDISFAVDPGEKFALVGESGSGKSVTGALGAASSSRPLPTRGAIRLEARTSSRRASARCAAYAAARSR
jgi:ABC-type multidrug transport system fused ATPase/permease subunit